MGAPAKTLQTEESLESRVRSVLAEVFHLRPEEITPDLAMGSHPRWDSLGHMNLIVRIEEVFGLRFPAQVIRTMTNVSAISESVEKRLRSEK